VTHALTAGEPDTHNEYLAAVIEDADLMRLALIELLDALQAQDLPQVLRCCTRLQSCGALLGDIARHAHRAGIEF